MKETTVVEMYGELGMGTTATRNVWSWVGGRLPLEMYGVLGRVTTATRNVRRVGKGDDCPRNVWRVGYGDDSH